MGLSMDTERRIAGIVLKHGEDEGMHWIQAEAVTESGSIDITASVTSYPRLSDEFVLKLQRVFAAELTKTLLEELSTDE